MMPLPLPLVTSIRITTQGVHETVAIWTRGGYSGTIIVDLGDGHQLVDVLLPEHVVSKLSDGATEYGYITESK